MSITRPLRAYGKLTIIAELQYFQYDNKRIREHACKNL